MSLPQFDHPGSSLEDVGSIVPALFDGQNKYQLFAQKVWPVLVGCREQLAECYTPENGRPALEPVVLLGVLILQFHRTGARPPSRRAGQIPPGLETGLAPQPQRSRLPSDDLGVLPAALTPSTPKVIWPLARCSKPYNGRGCCPSAAANGWIRAHVVAAVANLSGLECVRSGAAPGAGRAGRSAARSRPAGLLALAVGTLRGQ